MTCLLQPEIVVTFHLKYLRPAYVLALPLKWTDVIVLAVQYATGRSTSGTPGVRLDETQPYILRHNKQFGELFQIAHFCSEQKEGKCVEFTILGHGPVFCFSPTIKTVTFVLFGISWITKIKKCYWANPYEGRKERIVYEQWSQNLSMRLKIENVKLYWTNWFPKFRRSFSKGGLEEVFQYRLTYFHYTFPMWHVHWILVFC